MTTHEIASRLVEYCRAGEFETAQQQLYADDVESIEPVATKDFEKVTRGLPAIIEKNKKFDSMTEELHSCTISNPLVTDNTIAFILTMDITMKGGKRSKMSELCVYQVKDSKIISEQFFM